MKLSSLKHAVQDPNYRIHVPWSELESMLGRYRDVYALRLNPDFQRGHAWDSLDQKMYIQAKLTGRVQPDVIRLNCPGWQGDVRGQMVCVDGLQRITAALAFMHNEFAVSLCDETTTFDNVKFSDIEDFSDRVYFEFMVNSLIKKSDVIRWYIGLNWRGKPHSASEYERVSSLLIQTELKEAQGA